MVLPTEDQAEKGAEDIIYFVFNLLFKRHLYPSFYRPYIYNKYTLVKGRF